VRINVERPEFEHKRGFVVSEIRPPLDGSLDRQEAHPGLAWRSFVPDFMIQKLLMYPGETATAKTECTEAVVLFADVVGFTSMSEALAQAGSYGTEELTRILNSWFDSMVDRISHYRGSVAEFGGDALTAVFGYDRRTRQATVRRAVQCALDMQTATASFQAVATRAGTFGLAMKAGLAAGPLLHAIVGQPAIRLESVLAGRALDLAAAAEHCAASGEVVVDGTLLEDGLGIEVAERRGRWCVVGRLRRRASPLWSTPHEDVDEGVASRLVPFLHPVIAERLRSGRRELVNEHRKVTVAFLGLSAAIAGDQSGVAALQACVAAAVQVIGRYDGHLHQVTTGDKGSLLIVSFGAPVSHEDDEERAVHCCLELLKLPGVPCRAGIATGFVYCGEIGSDTRRTYTVIGDSVNLAARLMQAARPGQLLVDEATSQRVSLTTIQDRLEPVTVKGKSEPVSVWVVHAVRDRVRTHPGKPAPTSPLLGREQQVAMLETLTQRVLAGSGQVVCLTGAAGIGKTRLGAEAIRIAARRGFAVYGGACRSHGTASSYLVWRSVWRDLFQLDTSLPIKEQQAQLTSRVASRDGGSGRRAPLLAPVLNLPIADSELTAALDPQTRDEQLRFLLLDCLCDRAAGGPLLLVLEDCHWIDPASQALLEFLARNLADQPVLLVVTARGTVASSPLAPLSQLPWCTELGLGELATAHAEQLVEQRLRHRYGAEAVIAPDVVRRLAGRGEGNPFYLEELVSFLHARGVDPSDSRAIAAVDLPDSLHRLVMARIDQLDEGEKATIKVASVIGRRFLARWISKAYPAVGSPDEVARHLERLDELDLTPRYATVPELEYSFRHAVTQEAAYQSLTFQMREGLHERVGLLIEDAYPDRLAQYVDVLAYHYGRSRRVDKQRVWFRAAGDAAKSAFANEAAVEHYERLLPLLPEDQTAEVLVELGAVWNLTGRWPEAEQAYRRAMQVASRAGRREILAASQRDLGDLFMYTHSYAEAVKWLTQAADEFEQLGDQQGLSKTLDRITFALHQQGAYDRALSAAARHLAIATEAGDLAGMSIALNHTALVHLNTGKTTAALALLEQALDAGTRAGDRRCLLHAATNLGLVYLRHGDHLQAVAYSRQAFSVAQDIGYRQTAGVAIGNMGEVYRDQGDYAQATKCFVHALRIAVELRDWTGVADQVASVAATAAAQGDDQKAERLFAQAIRLTRLLNAPYHLCGCLHQLARLHVARGETEEGQRMNQEALEVANEHGERDVQVRAYLLSLHLQVALGRVDTGTAIGRLRALEPIWTEPSERAALLDALWQLDPTQEVTRKAAAGLYQTLYQRAPSVEFRKAYTQLTGTMLRPAPPLPPLPAPVDEEGDDIDQLLRQVDLTFRQLGTA
jgi:predicted ATPase/class 3 adenylate cyclase